MFKSILPFITCSFALSYSFAQDATLSFQTTDSALQQAFGHAIKLARSYQGNPADPAGPWYEAALPSRKAFCIRDVSHQSITAEALGMHAENSNMLRHFVSNIAESRDWCTFWEMNRLGLPAPEDYRNDSAFWYNLNANFELVDACWRMFLWTGNSTYIKDQVFTDFFDRSLTDYIDRWTLQPDSLLLRRAYPNAPAGFNINDHFHRCRGLPSYSEGVTDLKMGVDLVAAICRAFISASAIERWKGNQEKADMYAAKAEAYRAHLEGSWWDSTAWQYHTHVTNKSHFGKGEGEVFLLWFDVLRDSSRVRQTIGHLTSQNWNVETQSYLPLLLYRHGYWDKAYQYMLHLGSPATARNEYPEVSYGVLHGIIQGMMGVEADARTNTISTIFRTHNGHNAALYHLPVLSGRISVQHQKNKSLLRNEGNKPITWRVCFNGDIPFIRIAGKKMKTMRQTGILGNIISYADVTVPPGKQLEAGI